MGKLLLNEQTEVCFYVNTLREKSVELNTLLSESVGNFQKNKKFSKNY